MSLVRPEDLGAALGVVDRQAQRERDPGRKDPAEVVPPRMAPDVAPHQHHARAEHDVDVGALRGESQEIVDGVERRREVGVPEAHQVRRAPQARQDALADRGGLAPVRGQVDDVHGIRCLPPSARPGSPGVRSSLPSSTNRQPDRRAGRREVEEGPTVEAGLLVEARDDEDEAGRRHDFAIESTPARPAEQLPRAGPRKPCLERGLPS